ncbi:MAG TPA: hypothetical protein VFS84_13570, partial [Candidatus Binatia bacterium]|nr:hypothetical protein [Candidatus Binatia bacterium]
SKELSPDDYFKLMKSAPRASVRGSCSGFDFRAHIVILRAMEAYAFGFKLRQRRGGPEAISYP